MHIISEHLHSFESVLDGICFEILATFFTRKIVLEFEHGFRCGSLSRDCETLNFAPKSGLFSAYHSEGHTHL